MSFSRSGVTTMKMMSSTRTTSTSGVMLMSFLTPLEPPTAIPMALCQSSRGELGAPVLLARRHRTAADVFLLQLGGDDVEQLVRRLRDVDGAGVDPAGEVVEHHDRRDGDEEAEGRRDEGLGDTGRDGAEAAGAGGRHRLERVDDAHDGAEEADE